MQRRGRCKVLVTSEVHGVQSRAKQSRVEQSRADTVGAQLRRGASVFVGNSNRRSIGMHGVAAYRE